MFQFCPLMGFHSFAWMVWIPVNVNCIKLLLSEFNSILVIPFMSAPSSTLSVSPL